MLEAAKTKHLSDELRKTLERKRSAELQMQSSESQIPKGMRVVLIDKYKVEGGPIRPNSRVDVLIPTLVTQGNGIDAGGYKVIYILHDVRVYSMNDVPKTVSLLVTQYQAKQINSDNYRVVPGDRITIVKKGDMAALSNEAPWGDWKNDWSVRLTTAKTVWTVDDLPLFTIDVRKREEADEQPQSLCNWLLEVDKQQFSIVDDEGEKSDSAKTKQTFQPGKEIDAFATFGFYHGQTITSSGLGGGPNPPLLFTGLFTRQARNDVWTGKYSLIPSPMKTEGIDWDRAWQRFKWTPGKHVVRVAFSTNPLAVGEAKRAYVFSNSLDVEIQNAAPQGTTKSAAGKDGAFDAQAKDESGAWDTLGLQLRPMPASEFKQRFDKSRYRGGLLVTDVRQNSPAAEQGVRAGDVLVGLHIWETLAIENVSYVLHRSDIKDFSPLKFYILRGKETLYGFMRVNMKAAEDDKASKLPRQHGVSAVGNGSGTGSRNYSTGREACHRHDDSQRYARINSVGRIHDVRRQ